MRRLEPTRPRQRLKTERPDSPASTPRQARLHDGPVRAGRPVPAPRLARPRLRGASRASRYSIVRLRSGRRRCPPGCRCEAHPGLRVTTKVRLTCITADAQEAVRRPTDATARRCGRAGSRAPSPASPPSRPAARAAHAACRTRACPSRGRARP